MFEVQRASPDYSWSLVKQQHRPRGEAWREKAPRRVIALNCVAIGHSFISLLLFAPNEQ